jgi:hypothetical protein
MSPDARARVEEAEQLRRDLGPGFYNVLLARAVERAKSGDMSELAHYLPRARKDLEYQRAMAYAEGKTPEALEKEHAELRRQAAGKRRGADPELARRMRLVAGAYEYLTDQPLGGRPRRTETA